MHVVPEALLDVPPVPQTIDLARRNSLSRALTPGYLGINPQDYLDITYAMVDFVQPDHLYPHLVGVPPFNNGTGNPHTVSYYAGRQQGEVTIAVTPREAKLMPRHVGAIRGAARITTAAAVQTEFPTDQDMSREQRSGQHVHESKLATLTSLRDNVYLPQRGLLNKFIKASDGRNFGLSMFGGEAQTRAALATLQTQIFGDMVKAYGYQRGLPESLTRQVEKAITASIVLLPNPQDTHRNFAALVRFARGYNGHKLAAVNERIAAIEKQLS